VSRLKEQTPEQVIDISGWAVEQEFDPYPEGAREKSCVICPDPAPYPFLIPGHKYLFKQAFHRYPWQFWMEIIAYRIGVHIGVDVPPAFAAFHSRRSICGALIEWFYDYPGGATERYVPGGDYMVRLINNFDRKKGELHNLEDFLFLCRFFEAKGYFNHDWRTKWCEILAFDALIGNTDRHQDNWGILWRHSKNGWRCRFAPAYDNGTSLGYEILDNNLEKFDQKKLETYISRGCHHLRLRRKPAKCGGGHFILIEQFLRMEPEALAGLHKFDSTNLEELKSAIIEFVQFKLPEPLSENRLNFMLLLLGQRLDHLKTIFLNKQ